MPKKQKVRGPLVERERHINKDAPKDSRRLDNLATILAVENSICVATCLVNGKLYITENNLFSGSGTKKENTQLKTMNAVLDYFKNKHPSEADREAIFKKICSVSRLKSLVARSSLYMPLDTAGTADLLAKHTLTSDPQKIIDHIKEGKEDAAAYGLAFGEAWRVYQSFKKIDALAGGRELSKSSSSSSTSSLTAADEDESKNKEDEEKTSIELLRKALVNGDVKILHGEPVKGVHAEVQLLSHIIKMVKSGEINAEEHPEIYIGISKLRCLHCNIMIEQAQGILKKYGVKIILQARGEHNREFDWVVPNLFERGYELSSQPKLKSGLQVLSNKNTHLEDSIGYVARKKIDQALETSQAVPGSMVIPLSDSEQESVGAEERLREKSLEKLQDELSLVVRMQEDGENYADVLRIATRLHDLPEFSDLYSEGKLDNRTVILRVSAILDGYSERFSDDLPLSKELLLKILQAPSLVGKEVSSLFKEGQSLPKERLSSSSSSSSSSASAGGLAPFQPPLSSPAPIPPRRGRKAAKVLSSSKVRSVGGAAFSSSSSSSAVSSSLGLIDELSDVSMLPRVAGEGGSSSRKRGRSTKESSNAPSKTKKAGAAASASYPIAASSSLKREQNTNKRKGTLEEVSVTSLDTLDSYVSDAPSLPMLWSKEGKALKKGPITGKASKVADDMKATAAPPAKKQKKERHTLK